MIESVSIPNTIDGDEDFCSSCAEIPFGELLTPNDNLTTSAEVGTGQTVRKLLHTEDANIETTGGHEGDYLALWPIDHIRLESSCPLCSFLRGISIEVGDWAAPRHLLEGWTASRYLVCTFPAPQPQSLESKTLRRGAEGILCAILGWCHEKDIWDNQRDREEIANWYKSGKLPYGLRSNFERLVWSGQILHARTNATPRKPGSIERTVTGSITEIEAVRRRIAESSTKSSDLHSSSSALLEQIDQHLPYFRVIDCDSQNIVQLPTSTDYLTLSYVWGSIEEEVQLILTSLPEDTPKVIRDAIEVTKCLGFQYLWVDRYCIPQDHLDAKHEQISRMDIIYSNSFLTIVAAAGNGPEFGLSGMPEITTFRCFQRLENKPRLQIGHYSLHFYLLSIPYSKELEYSPVFKLLTSGDTATGCESPVDDVPGIASEILMSTWNTRGWTYQEAALAKRRLVFTRSFIYFQGSSSEARSSWPWIFRSGVLAEVYPPIFADVPQQESESWVRNAQLMATHAQGYVGRRLTFLTDGYNAFRGIQSALQRAFPSMVCFYGLPVRSCPSDCPVQNARRLATALLWVMSGPSRTLRRCSKFPSWTWIGWHGPLDSNRLTGPTWMEHKADISSTVQRVAVLYKDGTVFDWAGSTSLPNARLWGGEIPTLLIEGWTFKMERPCDSSCPGVHYLWQVRLGSVLLDAFIPMEPPYHDLNKKLDELLFLILGHTRQGDSGSDGLGSGVFIMALRPIGIGVFERVAVVQFQLPRPWSELDKESLGWAKHTIVIH